MSKIRLRFWGVRGSVPCPGPGTVKYGGNTACLELRFGEPGRLVVIDAGTGIRELAAHVMKTDLPKGPVKTQLFLTHTHWDHIMGFPFFIPIFIPTTELDVYGPVTYEEDTLDKILFGMLTYRYWPVRLEELASKIRYYNLKEGSRDLGEGLWVTTKYLNHPINVLGYRFEYQGKVLCTAYDTEPFRNVFDVPADSPGYDAGGLQGGGGGGPRGKREGQPILPGGRHPGARHPVHPEGIPGRQGGLGSFLLRVRRERRPPGGGEAPAAVPPRPGPHRRPAGDPGTAHPGRRAGARELHAGIHGQRGPGSRGLSLEQARPTCYYGADPGGLAQLVERLVRNQ